MSMNSFCLSVHALSLINIIQTDIKILHDAAFYYIIFDNKNDARNIYSSFTEMHKKLHCIMAYKGKIV